MRHDLKIHPEHFKAYFLQSKNFEIRKNNRNYQFKDLLILKEWNPETGIYTGKKLAREVREVYENLPGIKEGYVILQLREPLTNPFVRL